MLHLFKVDKFAADKMIARKFVIKSYFEGAPKIEDFELVEEKLTELKENEILISGLCFSVDPYMRAFGNADRVNIGDTITGQQVAEVIESKNSKFPVGSKVTAIVGWRDKTICNPDTLRNIFSNDLPAIELLPELHGLPSSYALGALGLTGLTAYFGFLKLCNPKESETVVVNTAAGAVGSFVAQIAQLKGCKVLAFTGSDEKVKWLKEDLKIKFAFNYKEVHLDSILKKYAVEGVDCYFDNVGGDFSSTVIKNMSPFGRIALCGAISQYNNKINAETKVSFDYFSFLYKNLKMEGFMYLRWASEFESGIKDLIKWINEGKIIVRETHTKGFVNMPQAFIQMLAGENLGKSIVDY